MRCYDRGRRRASRSARSRPRRRRRRRTARAPRVCPHRDRDSREAPRATDRARVSKRERRVVRREARRARGTTRDLPRGGVDPLATRRENTARRPTTEHGARTPAPAIPQCARAGREQTPGGRARVRDRKPPRDPRPCTRSPTPRAASPEPPRRPDGDENPRGEGGGFSPPRRTACGVASNARYSPRSSALGVRVGTQGAGRGRRRRLPGRRSRRGTRLREPVPGRDARVPGTRHRANRTGPGYRLDRSPEISIERAIRRSTPRPRNLVANLPAPVRVPAPGTGTGGSATTRPRGRGQNWRRSQRARRDRGDSAPAPGTGTGTTGTSVARGGWWDSTRFETRYPGTVCD